MFNKLIYSANESESCKTKTCSYFCEISCDRSFFILSIQNFNLKYDVSCIKFVETCRAGGKSAKEDYL